MEESQISMSEVRQRLVELGYHLVDNGDHWRTSALYRGGKNPTSIFIYKNTGVWRDFGVDSNISYPFTKLLELTTGETGFEKEFSCSFIEGYKQFIQDYELMERIYPKSYLDKLLPNYHFYKQRGISEDTQKLYCCGLASSGKMYRRVTFPIFNESSQIIGWSGRTIENKSNVPKWKHLGKKRNWLYPYYMDDIFNKACDYSKDIYLIESIGDSLALSENKIYNHFVLFGVSMSSKVLSKLIELNPERIIISLNNDSNKEYNTGMVNAVKIYLNLLSFFSKERVEILFPYQNDFGEWHQTQVGEMIKMVLRKPIVFDTRQALDDTYLLDKNNKMLSQQHQKQLRKVCNG